jgi:excisionase family DNA binding protein
LEIHPAMNPRHHAAPGRIMTAAEVAQYLRCHRSTLYKLIRDDRLPVFKIGSDYRFYRDEIDKWMTDRQILKEK